MPVAAAHWAEVAEYLGESKTKKWVGGESTRRKKSIKNQGKKGGTIRSVVSGATIIAQVAAHHLLLAISYFPIDIRFWFGGAFLSRRQP